MVEKSVSGLKGHRMLHAWNRRLGDAAAVRIAAGFRAMAQFAPFVRTEDTFVKGEILQRLSRETEQLKTQGLFKPERVLASPQQRRRARRPTAREVINLCANNYLGLANHASVREAARRALDRYGYGMASVRFICGTQQHPQGARSSG